MAQPSLYSREYQLLRSLIISERKRQKLTQFDVAKRMRRAQSYISKIETGERRLDVLDLIRLAKAVGFEPGPFVTRLAKELGK